MKRRGFIKALAVAPLAATPFTVTAKASEPAIKIGDIVAWKEWSYCPQRQQWVRLSIVTCAWSDGSVLLDDHRGIHSRELTVVGHSDSITASCGVIHSKPK